MHFVKVSRSTGSSCLINCDNITHILYSGGEYIVFLSAGQNGSTGYGSTPQPSIKLSAIEAKKIFNVIGISL